MQSVKKFRLVPHSSITENVNTRAPNEQEGAGPSSVRMNDDGEELPRNTIRAHAEERQRKLIHLILKIAAVNGYNENRQIRKSDGSFLENSDLIPLLTYAITKEKLVLSLIC